MKSFLGTFFRFLGWMILLAAMVRLFRAADADSQDFHVYWKTVVSWQEYGFPYRILASDQGFVFKYPPWILPLLSPLGWLTYEFSKGIWAFFELWAVFFSFRWMEMNGVTRKVALGVTALFWYIWLAHFYAGQVTLFLLAAALWAFTPPRNDFKFSIVATFFTAKVFSAYSLAGVWRQLFRRRVIAYGIALLVVANLGLLFKTHFSFSAWLELYQGWMRAAGSGGAELGAEVVRGTGNHGFPAGILRWIDPEAKSLHWDLLVSLGLALGLGTLWSQISKTNRFDLSAAEHWAGWLAYGVIVHPLAWHHSFVLAYPLCAFSLQKSLLSKKRSLILLSLLGIALIGLLVPQVVGKTLVKPFELLSCKSWGVLCATLALLLSSKKESVA